MIYLDDSATMRPLPNVVESIYPYLTEKWFNPSSLYDVASIVKTDCDAARSKIAKFIGANSNEIYFTSGACESNSWVIQKFATTHKPLVITSSIEHKSIVSMTIDKTNGIEFAVVGVDQYGFINIEDIKRIIEMQPLGRHILVSVIMANNEIGTIQDIAQIANELHQYENCYIHTDVTQALGHIPVNVKQLGVDFLSASAQKIGGLKGAGILYIRNKCKTMISPLIYGSQESGLRGGTENVVGVIAFAKAIEECDVKHNYKVLAKKRDYFVDSLRRTFGDQVQINGPMETQRRLPNNINITFKFNITGESLVYMLSKYDIYVSSGSACNATQPSHVLQAIGLNKEDGRRTIRITVGKDISNNDIEFVVTKLKEILFII